MITITINGELRQLPQAVSIATLLESLGYSGKRIALERNGKVVPRGAFATTQLADGDQLEIVVAVGGG